MFNNSSFSQADVNNLVGVNRHACLDVDVYSLPRVRRNSLELCNLSLAIKPRNMTEKDTNLSSMTSGEPQRNSSLVIDKIAAPPVCLSAPVIERPRLHEMLHESLRAGATTVITGRAGSGKTTLAAAFAPISKRPLAWFKVDASDARLHIFLQYLTESICRVRPDFGKENDLRVVLDGYARHGINAADATLLAEYFAHEIQATFCYVAQTPLLIVVDDLHLIYDADWFAPFFNRLLPLLPPEAHLFVIGRSLPPSPLWRMRSKQTLCVIDEDNLNFTSEEAAELFRRYNLSPEQSLTALDETHGRARDIHATAQSQAGISQAA